MRAHAILHDVPLHDVWRLDLQGGGDGRTVADIRTLVSANRLSGLVRLLFAIRWLLGQLFRWDRESAGGEGLFQLRITEADRARSTVATGTKDGPFTVLYVHPTEAMSEIRNSTVHAALVWVLIRRKDGYPVVMGHLCETGWMVYRFLHVSHRTVSAMDCVSSPITLSASLMVLNISWSNTN